MLLTSRDVHGTHKVFGPGGGRGGVGREGRGGRLGGGRRRGSGEGGEEGAAGRWQTTWTDCDGSCGPQAAENVRFKVFNKREAACAGAAHGPAPI